jgi:hypothetical protein
VGEPKSDRFVDDTVRPSVRSGSSITIVLDAGQAQERRVHGPRNLEVLIVGA